MVLRTYFLQDYSRQLLLAEVKQFFCKMVLSSQLTSLDMNEWVINIFKHNIAS